MSKYKKGTPQYEKQLAADRERKRKKRLAEANSVKNSPLDLQTPPEKVEVAPESAMQASLEISYSNEKQPGQLMSDAAFHDYLDRQNRRK